MSLVKHAFVLQFRKKSEAKGERKRKSYLGNGVQWSRHGENPLEITGDHLRDGNFDARYLMGLTHILIRLTNNQLASSVDTMDLMATMGGMFPSNPLADSFFDLTILFCNLSSINIKILYMAIKNKLH
jgi:hypothetical protein